MPAWRNDELGHDIGGLDGGTVGGHRAGGVLDASLSRGGRAAAGLAAAADAAAGFAQGDAAGNLQGAAALASMFGPWGQAAAVVLQAVGANKAKQKAKERERERTSVRLVNVQPQTAAATLPALYGWTWVEARPLFFGTASDVLWNVFQPGRTVGRIPFDTSSDNKLRSNSDGGWLLHPTKGRLYAGTRREFLLMQLALAAGELDGIDAFLLDGKPHHKAPGAVAESDASGVLGLARMWLLEYERPSELAKQQTRGNVYLSDVAPYPEVTSAWASDKRIELAGDGTQRRTDDSWHPGASVVDLLIQLPAQTEFREFSGLPRVMVRAAGRAGDNLGAVLKDWLRNDALGPNLPAGNVDADSLDLLETLCRRVLLGPGHNMDALPRLAAIGDPVPPFRSVRTDVGRCDALYRRVGTIAAHRTGDDQTPAGPADLFDASWTRGVDPAPRSALMLWCVVATTFGASTTLTSPWLVFATGQTPPTLADELRERGWADADDMGWDAEEAPPEGLNVRHGAFAGLAATDIDNLRVPEIFEQSLPGLRIHLDAEDRVTASPLDPWNPAAAARLADEDVLAFPEILASDRAPTHCVVRYNDLANRSEDTEAVWPEPDSPQEAVLLARGNWRREEIELRAAGAHHRAQALTLARYALGQRRRPRASFTADMRQGSFLRVNARVDVATSGYPATLRHIIESVEQDDDDWSAEVVTAEYPAGDLCPAVPTRGDHALRQVELRAHPDTRCVGVRIVPRTGAVGTVTPNVKTWFDAVSFGHGVAAPNPANVAWTGEGAAHTLETEDGAAGVTVTAAEGEVQLGLTADLPGWEQKFATDIVLNVGPRAGAALAVRIRQPRRFVYFAEVTGAGAAVRREWSLSDPLRMGKLQWWDGAAWRDANSGSNVVDASDAGRPVQYVPRRGAATGLVKVVVTSGGSTAGDSMPTREPPWEDAQDPGANFIEP